MMAETMPGRSKNVGKDHGHAEFTAGREQTICSSLGEGTAVISAPRTGPRLIMPFGATTRPTWVKSTGLPRNSAAWGRCLRGWALGYWVDLNLVKGLRLDWD